MELNSYLIEQGWSLLTSTEIVGIIFHANGHPNRLIVTFDSLADSTHRHVTVSSAAIVASCDADHAHVFNAEEGWFQSSDVFTVMPILQELCRQYSEVILYGHSMGGYAALLWSRPLGATNVVAFVPQFSIDPKRAPFETRFQTHAARIDFVFDDMDSTISPTASKHIVFDPHFSIDNQHYARLSKYENTVPIRVPFTGHYPGQFMREAGLLRTIVTDLLLGGTNTAARRRLIREGRRRSHRYLVERAVHVARRGQIRDAFKLANAAYVLSPDNPSVLETFHALLQFDSAYYGVSHALIRLVLKEKPEWTFYNDKLNLVWNEIVIKANPIIRGTNAADCDQFTSVKYNN